MGDLEGGVFWLEYALEGSERRFKACLSFKMVKDIALHKKSLRNDFLDFFRAILYNGEE